MQSTILEPEHEDRLITRLIDGTARKVCVGFRVIARGERRIDYVPDEIGDPSEPHLTMETKSEVRAWADEIPSVEIMSVTDMEGNDIPTDIMMRTALAELVVQRMDDTDADFYAQIDSKTGEEVEV